MGSINGSSAEPSPGISASPRARKRVLIVDDEKMVGTLLARFLRHTYEVIAVDDPEEALARIETEAYDLILTDFRMPKYSGLDILARANEHHPEVPVVVMSGHVPEGDSASLLAAGAAGFLAKPFPRKAQVNAYLADILARGN